MTLPAVFYSLACIVVGFVNISDEEIVYYCMPPSAFRLDALNFWVMTNMLICLLVVVIYTAAYVTARKLGKRVSLKNERNLLPGFGGNSNSQSEERKQRTLQSLMLIMAVYVCTWFMTVSILTIINLPQMSASALSFLKLCSF